MWNAQLYHVNKVEQPLSSLEEMWYKINVILSYKSYFILQELYQVKLHPHPLHSSAKGTWTLVDPIGYPHFLAPWSTSTTTLREPTIYLYVMKHSEVLIFVGFVWWSESLYWIVLIHFSNICSRVDMPQNKDFKVGFTRA